MDNAVICQVAVAMHKLGNYKLIAATAASRVHSIYHVARLISLGRCAELLTVADN